MLKFNPQLLLVDKPVGISSFAVVAKIRQLSGEKKVGHAGTLDPMASGLLIVLVGKDYTAQADKFLKLDKEYAVELTLGKTSATGDQEGPITDVSEIKPTLAEVKQVLKNFLGTIVQTPPRHSAVKINGVRAYARARQNEQFSVPSRYVTIFKIEAEQYNYPYLNFRVQVSSGTYIRSLAEDIGHQLGTGAYLSRLRRITIGPYLITKAVALEEIAQI